MGLANQLSPEEFADGIKDLTDVDVLFFMFSQFLKMRADLFDSTSDESYRRDRYDMRDLYTQKLLVICKRIAELT